MMTMNKMKVKNLLNNILTIKLLNYIEPDNKAMRDITGDGSLDPSERSYDYVNRSFLMNIMNTHCQNCGEVLTVKFENGKCVSNVSCQPVNNDLSHCKDNCIQMRVQCNCAFLNKMIPA